LIADSGGEAQISNGLVECDQWSHIAADNLGQDFRCSDGVLKTNQKARQNPKALAQPDAYKRGLVNSLTGKGL